MITLPEAAALLGFSDARLKQIFKANPQLKYIQRRGKGTPNQIPHQTIQQLLMNRGLSFRKTYATIGQEKGGVGKSLLTVNTAINLVRKGANGLIVDLDPEACATNLLLPDEFIGKQLSTIYEIFKHDGQIVDTIVPTRFDGLDLVPCRGKARRVDRMIADENPKFLLRARMMELEHYDFIFFEVPPTFSRLITAAYLTSEIVVMPTFPDTWSLESIALTIEDIKEDAKRFEAHIPEIKILLNKFNPTRKASKEAWSYLAQTYPDLFLPFQIKESAELQNSINDGACIFDLRRIGTQDVRESISLLADLICPLEGHSELEN